jgi:hypothetical protein
MVGRLLVLVVRLPTVKVRAVVPVNVMPPPVRATPFVLLMMRAAIDLLDGISAPVDVELAAWS